MVISSPTSSKGSAEFIVSVSKLLLAGALTLSLVLPGCLRRDRLQPLPNDAYVWQRHWNDALLTALTESSSAVRAWRVLAAEADTNAELTKIAVNRPALRRTAKPVIAVIRIDGRSGALLTEQLAEQSAALAAAWIKAGVPVRGIEIDYDCAANRLGSYRDFLRRLRARLPRQTALSITALPSWMKSPDLPNLLATVDETVLQVHSVMSPKKGLLDGATARQWAQAWSALSPVPFRLALPTYWSRVTWNEDGRVASIESEVARYGAESAGRELIVEPLEVSKLLSELRQTPLRHLTGIAWFRLPTAEDRRAWTQSTWYAVMRGQSLRITPPVVHFQTDPNGAKNVYVRNEGDLDEKLPAEVFITAGECAAADALPPYNFEETANGIRFRLKNDDLLRAGQERLIGWIRCSGGKVEGHVAF